MKWLPLLLAFGCQAAPPRANVPASRASSDAPAPGPTGVGLRSVLPEAPPARTRDARAPGKGLPGVTSDCSSDAVSRWASFLVVNDVRGATSDGSFEQCVLGRQTDGKAQLGWTWSWTGFEPLGFGFPGVVLGWRPGSSTTPDARLPLRIADVRALTVRYRVATESVGQAPLVLALRFTSDAPSEANPSAVVGEARIWLDYPRAAAPPGTKRGIAEVIGARYEVWHAPSEAPADDGAVDRYTFRGPNGHRDGTVALDGVLAYLVQAALVAPERFVASVELGNEVMSGSGTTWLEDYDVQVAARAPR